MFLRTSQSGAFIRWATLAAGAALLSSCSSSINSVSPISTGSAPPGKTIQHIIIMVQENRSFNTMFMNFSGADTVTHGRCKTFIPKYGKPVCQSQHIVKLKAIPLASGNGYTRGKDIAHDHATFETEYDGGKMDGFGSITFGTVGSAQPARTYPYAYVSRKDIQPYWDMASQYALADHMFSTATTDSFVAHQQLIAGTTQIAAGKSVTNVPSNFPWGCDGPPGTVTDLILSDGKVRYGAGPFPCFTQYQTMADVLDAASVAWKYYVPSLKALDWAGQHWNAFDAIRHVRYGSDWKNVVSPNTAILNDVRTGHLPAVSWVIPELRDSDHPGSGTGTGPSWVASIVNAVGRSNYWKSTAIIVLWDDWGGFYDNVPPPQLDYVSLGVRVPMIVVSPYVKPHSISKTQYEFGSVLKYIEENFGTASLGATDARANSIGDMFDYNQRPIPFKPISAPHKDSYFFSRAPAPQVPADAANLAD